MLFDSSLQALEIRLLNLMFGERNEDLLKRRSCDLVVHNLVVHLLHRAQNSEYCAQTTNASHAHIRRDLVLPFSHSQTIHKVLSVESVFVLKERHFACDLLSD